MEQVYCSFNNGETTYPINYKISGGVNNINEIHDIYNNNYMMPSLNTATSEVNIILYDNHRGELISEQIDKFMSNFGFSPQIMSGDYNNMSKKDLCRNISFTIYNGRDAQSIGLYNAMISSFYMYCDDCIRDDDTICELTLIVDYWNIESYQDEIDKITKELTKEITKEIDKNIIEDIMNNDINTQIELPKIGSAGIYYFDDDSKVQIINTDMLI